MSALPNFFGGEAVSPLRRNVDSGSASEADELSSAYGAPQANLDGFPEQPALGVSLPGENPWGAAAEVNHSDPVTPVNRGMAWRQRQQETLKATLVRNAAEKLLQENERVRRHKEDYTAVARQGIVVESTQAAASASAGEAADNDFDQFKSPQTAWQGATTTPAYFLAQQKRRTSMLDESSLPPLPCAFKPDTGLPSAYQPRTPPTEIKVKLDGDTGVLLQWQNGGADDSEIEGYRIVMHEVSDGIPSGRHSERISKTKDTQLRITRLSPGAQVKFKIATLYSDGQSSGLSGASMVLQLPTVNQLMQVEVITLIQPGTELGHLVHNFVDGTSELVSESANSAAHVTAHFKDAISTQIADGASEAHGGTGLLRRLWDSVVSAEGLSELDADEVQQRFLSEIITILESQAFGALEQQLYEGFRGQCRESDQKVINAVATLSESSFDFWMIPPKTTKNMQWDAVVRALNTLSSSSRRRDMVQSMMEALQEICKGVGGGEGADAIFPALLYAMSHSQVKYLVGTLMFLGRTLPESQQYGQEACYLTTVSAAVNYLHDRSWPAQLPDVHSKVIPTCQVDLFHQDE